MPPLPVVSGEAAIRAFERAGWKAREAKRKPRLAGETRREREPLSSAPQGTGPRHLAEADQAVGTFR